MESDTLDTPLELPAVLLEPICECWGELDCCPKDLGRAFDPASGFTLCARINATAKGYVLLQKGNPPTGWSFTAPSAHGKIAFESGAREGDDLLPPPPVVEEAPVVADTKQKPSKGPKSAPVTEPPPPVESKIIADIGSTSVDDGRWYHVAVTYRDGRIYAYVDGILDGELGVEVHPAKDAALIVGARVDGSADENEAAKGITNVQAFATPLSAYQIAGLANESKSLSSTVSLPLTPRQVRHFWKLRKQALPMEDIENAGHVHYLCKAFQDQWASTSGSIYAVSADKKVVEQVLGDMTPSSSWGSSTSTNGSVISIASYGGTTYGVSTDNKVCTQGYDQRTKKQVWQEVSAGEVINIAVDADTIYGVGIDNKVYRQSLAQMTTSSSWTLASAGDVISVAVYGEMIYGVGLDNRVYKQSLIGMTTTSPWVLASAGDVISIVVYAGTIYGVGTDNKVKTQYLDSMTLSSPWTLASAGDVLDIEVEKKFHRLFRTEVICDFFVSLLEYAQSISLTARKTAVFVGIMQRILDCMYQRSKTSDCVGDPYSSSECFLELKKLFLAHAATASGALSAVPPSRVQIFTIPDIKRLTEFVAGTLFQHFFLYQCCLVSPEERTVTYTSVVLEGPLSPPDLNKAKMLPPRQETILSPTSKDSFSDLKGEVLDGNTLDPSSLSFPDENRTEGVEGGVDEEVVDNLTRALSRPRSSNVGGTTRDDEIVDYHVSEASKTAHQTIESSIKRRDEALKGNAK